MTATRLQLEKWGLCLRTPPGRLILEVPAEFGWDDLEVGDKADIFREFGFDGLKPLIVKTEDTRLGKQYQFTQEMKSPLEAIPFETDQIARSLGITTDMGQAALNQALELIKILDKKQKDYGSNNIAKFGLSGVIVRLSDKIERLINLDKQETAPIHESIEDTLGDTANYAIIGLLCQKGLWK